MVTSLAKPRVPTVYSNPVPLPYSGSKLTTKSPAKVGKIDSSTVVASTICVTVEPAIISPLPLTFTMTIPATIPELSATVK